VDVAACGVEAVEASSYRLPADDVNGVERQRVGQQNTTPSFINERIIEQRK
jgi:hypothetical protein